MRIGLAFGSRDMIAGMVKIKDSYNLNRLSLVAATAALQDMRGMKRNVRRIQQARAQLSQGLKRLGFFVHPSQANFVLARREGQNLKCLYEDLKTRKILVRYFDLPALQDALRITVGTPRQVEVLTKEIEAIANG
jgi:histidinol-phosphate aminotransferase